MQTSNAVNIFALAVLFLFLLLPPSSDAQQLGYLVQIEQLTFHPDTMSVPGGAFAVLVLLNREDSPIPHEVTFEDLFEAGTLVAIQGTGTILYRISASPLRF